MYMLKKYVCRALKRFYFEKLKKKLRIISIFTNTKMLKLRMESFISGEETPAACDHTDNPPLSCTESMQERYYIRVASVW